jgi:dTDP-4-dehydrorhamnose 3,5-epimerase
VPEGFVVISESAEFLYKTTGYYATEFERCIAWKDSRIGIDCSFKEQPQLSGKDQQGILLENSDAFA